MGKTESKITNSNLYSNKIILSEINNHTFKLPSSLSIFSSSWNIINSSNYKSKIVKTNLSKLLNTKIILLDTEMLLSNFIIFELSQNQNLCLISTTFQHTLKENCREIQNHEFNEITNNDSNIDIFIRGFLRFMNIFSNYIESKSKKLIGILKTFKKNTYFNKMYLIENKNIESIINSNNISNNQKELENNPESDQKSRNGKNNKVYETSNINNKNTEKKIIINKNISNVVDKKIKNKYQNNIISNKVKNELNKKNILIEDNSNRKIHFVKNNEAIKTKDKDINKRNNDYRNNHSANKVIKTETIDNLVSNSIEKKNNIISVKNDKEIDFNLYIKENNRKINLVSKRENNVEVRNNPIIGSLVQNDQYSSLENSNYEGNSILTISKEYPNKAYLSRKDCVSMNINKHKMKGNQSIQGDSDSKINSSRVSSNNPIFQKQFASNKDSVILGQVNNSLIINNLESFNHKDNLSQSIKSNKTVTFSNKNIIQNEENKLSNRKIDKNLSSPNINKSKSPVTKRNLENQTPTIFYEKNKTIEIQQNTPKNTSLQQTNKNKTNRNAESSNVQNLNVKININQVNQHQTNNNTFNNMYETHIENIKNKIKFEKNTIPEEKENYSSPDSESNRLLIFHKKLKQKTESSNSDSDTNIDIINGNRNNTPAFNNLHKRSNSSVNSCNLIEEIKDDKRKISERDLSEDEKFSFKNSDNDSNHANEDELKPPLNYITQMNENINNKTNFNFFQEKANLFNSNDKRKIFLDNQRKVISKSTLLGKKDSKIKTNNDSYYLNDYLKSNYLNKLDAKYSSKTNVTQYNDTSLKSEQKSKRTNK